jgi:hypothetical protein
VVNSLVLYIYIYRYPQAHIYECRILTRSKLGIVFIFYHMERSLSNR